MTQDLPSEGPRGVKVVRPDGETFPVEVKYITKTEKGFYVWQVSTDKPVYQEDRLEFDFFPGHTQVHVPYTMRSPEEEAAFRQKVQNAESGKDNHVPQGGEHSH